MEFAVRALRGWTVPLVITIPKAWKIFDQAGRTVDPNIEERLRVLGREVAQAARLFSSRSVTTPEAEPLSEKEAEAAHKIS